MSFPAFFSLKNKLVPTSCSLVLVVMLKFCGCCTCSSLYSTLFLLVLPISLPFVFSKIKQLVVSGSMEEPTLEFKICTDEIVQSDDYPPLEKDNPLSDCFSESKENLEVSSCSPVLESSDCSDSDDESLIEIALENEYVPDQLLPEFSAEVLLRNNGFMELLSEINDEDNMIEIDITMGSIKCSRYEIEA